MLVLGRTIGQAILIPEFDIKITVTNISRGSVRLGITAPRRIQVIREELFVKLVEEERAADQEAAAAAITYVDVPLVEQPAEAPVDTSTPSVG